MRHAGSGHLAYTAADRDDCWKLDGEPATGTLPARERAVMVDMLATRRGFLSSVSCDWKCVHWLDGRRDDASAAVTSNTWGALDPA